MRNTWELCWEKRVKYIVFKMLVASVAFDLTHIFTLVFTSLLYQKAGIEKTIVSTVYNGDKIQSGVV